MRGTSGNFFFPLLLYAFILSCSGFGLCSDGTSLHPPQGSRSSRPDLAFARDGTLWVAWSSYQGGRFRLAVSCLPPGGRWTEVSYPDPQPTDQVDPCLVMDPGGGIVLFYASFEGRRWRINRTSHLREGWQMPVVVGEGIHPTAIMSEGKLWTAWENDGNLFLVQTSGSEHNPHPLSLVPDHPLRAYSSPVLASGSGVVWLAWTCAQPGYQSVLLRRMDGEHHPPLVVDDGSGINRNPQLSVDQLGRAWVVFESLQHRPGKGTETWKSSGRPVYELDRVYGVEFPSRAVRVSDGRDWWIPAAPTDPAPGLAPSLICSSRGTVWVVSRSFTGYARPFSYFLPLGESLGRGGWANHGRLRVEGLGEKTPMPLAEGPEGRVWTAWVLYEREKKGYLDTPSWTHMDGPDEIVLSLLPGSGEGGYPPLVPLEKKEFSFPPPQEIKRYRTSYRGESLQVYFGDLHQHSEISGCGRRNGRVDENQFYTRHVRGLDFMCTIDHAEHHNAHTWRMTQLAAQMSNRPGRFVTFTGFEWTSEFDAGGNLYRGHYNAVYRTPGSGGRYFSASDPRTNTPLELWDALKQAAGGPGNVLTFAHHPSRRMAWLSWNYYDPDMVPLIEIAQSRGSYEYEGCFAGLDLKNDCARVQGHYIRDGLERGMKWGFIASGDHGGRQLAAVYASRLDREHIFRALKRKQAYATSGEKMFLDVRVNGRFMGETFLLEEASRTIEITASGTAPLVEVEIFRNGRSLRKQALYALSASLKWEDRRPFVRRENAYYVRVLQADGGQAWSSPVWVIDPGMPGAFRFQVGGDELRVVYPGQETDMSILMHNEKDVPVRGTVFLVVPDGWTVREREGIRIDCPPGGWRHAVFHVEASREALPRLCLPELRARFLSSEGERLESRLFVVGGPSRITREQKAELIDAREGISEADFRKLFGKIVRSWQKEP